MSFRLITHPALITLLCIKGGVTFSETKEKCPRSSPLTLTRVLKTPAQGKEVERARIMKRTSIELPREAIPKAKEDPKAEEMRGFKDYPKQPMLSSRAEETISAHNRAEKRKRRTEEQESSNSELFSLLTEMREEMKRRDEQLKEELR